MGYIGTSPSDEALKIGDDVILSSHINDGVIVNADINASAAIATSKVSGALTSVGSHGLATSATTDTTNASNIASGTLNKARLPADSDTITSVGTLGSLTVDNININGNDISSTNSDGDILFKGNDGGSTITALTLDMSESGKATFNNWVYVNNRVMGSSGDIRIGSNDGDEMLHLLADGTAKIDTAGTTALTIDSSQNATFAGDVTLGGDAQLESTYTNLQIYMPSNATGFVLASGASNTNARNWGLYTNYSDWGHLDFRVSSEKDAVAHTTEVLSLKRDGSATFSGSVTSAGTLHVKNSNSTSSGIEVGCNAGDFKLFTFNSTHTTNGGFVSDSATVDADDNLSGGLSIMARHSSGEIRFYTGGYAAGNQRLKISDSGNIMMESGNGLYFDGGSNTYIKEGSGDTLNFYTGGNNVMTLNDNLELTGNLNSSGTAIASKFYSKGATCGASETISFTVGNGDMGIWMAQSSSGNNASMYWGVYFSVSGNSSVISSQVSSHANGNNTGIGVTVGTTDTTITFTASSGAGAAARIISMGW